MRGIREYQLKMFQQDKSEDLSREIATSISITNTNVNKCSLVDHSKSEALHTSFINKIILLTKDLNRTYETRHEAELAGELFKRIITECYVAMGYPVWGTKVSIKEGNESYKVEFDLDLDTSG